MMYFLFSSLLYSLLLFACSAAAHNTYSVVWIISSYIDIIHGPVWTKQLLQNHWVSGRCPSYGILHTRKDNISETGSVSAVRWWEGDTLQFPKRCLERYLEFWTMAEVHKLNGSGCYAPSLESFRNNPLFFVNHRILEPKLKWNWARMLGI
jgi:hypothetical protein